MTMTNAEWMIKNGHDFLRLDVKRVSGDSYAIMFDDKVKDTIRINDTVINALLTWLNKAHKEPILDATEKRYLSAVIRPFRDDVKYIVKYGGHFSSREYEFILVRYQEKMCGDKNFLKLPWFEKGAMYKGMELDKKYTLEELGL